LKRKGRKIREDTEKLAYLRTPFPSRNQEKMPSGQGLLIHGSPLFFIEG
jgi:hypothetical protein